MKTEINKFGVEIANIFSELAAIETTIQSELKRHTELTVKLADAFNSIKSQLDKKFELPMSSENSVSMTDAERLAVRKRFRNLGDVQDLPTVTLETVKKESTSDWAAKMLYGVSPRITYNKEKKKFLFLYANESFHFSLEEGYRLARVGEFLEKAECISSRASWRPISDVTVKENNYPIRCKI